MSDCVVRENLEQDIIPGLPDDLALRCLAKLSHGYLGILEAVSKRWRDVIRSIEYGNYKAKEGWCGDWLFVLTEGSKNEWVAYDPQANKWHPLPKISISHGDLRHFGFASVSVCNRFYVIGGAYACNDPPFAHRRHMFTSDVMQFDPFRKQWTKVASMVKPRSHFACAVVCGKIYVAGGRNLSYPRGLALAEVYDPQLDKWEELPAMATPQADCMGVSYRGKFHVLSDQVGMLDHDTSEVYDPSSGIWCIFEDKWPFSRAMQFAVQIIEDQQVYTVVDWGESLIKTRYDEKGEWHTVGSVPPVNLHDHSRPLETFGYGFTSLRHELYFIGGKVLKWDDDSGCGRFDIVNLNLVRVCDPLAKPLTWRETQSMYGPAGGSILGSASMAEESSKCSR